MKSPLLYLIFLCSVSFCFSQVPPSVAVIEINDLLYLEKDKVEVDSLQRLNLVIPENCENCPLLLWVGGGAWSSVDRHMEMNLAKMIASKGIAVASVGHRLSSAVWQDPARNSGVQHPAHLEDVAAAFSWLHSNAAEHGYDPSRIFVGGFSSGAHLITMLSMDEKYLAQYGLSLADISGMIPIGGTYDVVNYHEAMANGSRPQLAEQHVEAVFGATQKEWIDASPISYMEALAVPLLLISDYNMYNYTNIFDNKIRESDFRNSEVHYLNNFTHAELWRHLSNEDQSATRNLIIDFIRRNS